MLMFLAWAFSSLVFEFFVHEIRQLAYVWV